MPADGVADCRVSPAGRTSATLTLAAVSGPLLVTPIVNVTLPLSAGVAVSTVFVTATSACGTSTVAPSALLPALGSNVVADAIAVLVIGVVAVTVATMSSVAEAPLASVPRVHRPAAYAPADGVADTSVRPAGSASASDTLCAPSGPLLVTVTTKVTLLFNGGVASLTVFVTARSEFGTSRAADAVLSAGVESNVDDDTVAVFVICVYPVTVATMSRSTVTPLLSVPMVQTPPAYDPADGVADTKVSPDGSASATETDCAASGPLLATVTLNVTLAPSAGVASLTVFVTCTSASGASTDADAELFATTGS